MKKSSWTPLTSRQGNQILIGVIATTVLGVVAVGISRAYFSMIRLKTLTSARTSFIDYERAFVAGIGSQALAAISNPNCNANLLNQLNLPLGEIGSAKFLSSTTRGILASSLGVNETTTNSDQTNLNLAFNSCPNTVQSSATAPGTYRFCVGFHSPNDKGFNGMVGAFAKIRIDLSTRGNPSQQRVLAQAVSCQSFLNSPVREIKISYIIYFKKFNDSTGIFTKSGFQFYSN